jgi:hypothetical protein
MTNEQKVNLILTVANAIFNSKAANDDIKAHVIHTNTGVFPGRWFGDGKGGGTLRGFDFTVQDHTGIVSLRILEQNPNKTDQFGNLKQNAILARQGHQIAWVIRRDVNVFLGKIQDGQWEPTRPRATTKTTYNPAVPGTGVETPVTAQDQYGDNYAKYDNEWQADLPDIDPNDVPLYVTGVV